MSGNHVAYVERSLEDLVPRYMQRRRADVIAMTEALSNGDMEVVERLGHSMKGSGGGYGFDFITEVGGEIEAFAQAADSVAVREAVVRLGHYLDDVRVEYVDEDDEE